MHRRLEYVLANSYRPTLYIKNMHRRLQYVLATDQHYI